MIDSDTLALMIPILAVGGWIIPVTVKSVLKSQERRLELQLQAQQGRSEETDRRIAALSAEVAALSAEVAALRDTSTQFDMSLEHNVQHLEGRLGRLETRSAAQGAATPDEAPQRVGLR